MWRCAQMLMCVSAGVLAGCGPDIQTITPSGQQRLQMVMVEGIRMTGALIHVDGEPVAAAAVSALADPAKRRDVIIPLEKPDGTLTGVGTPDNQAVFVAVDPVGSDTIQYKNITSTAGPTTPTVTFITPPVVELFTGRVSVIIGGTGIYPAAGLAKVTQDKPFTGPDVEAVHGADPPVPAAETIFLAENRVLVYFNPGTLTSGQSYQIRVTNHARYGGNTSALSVPTFTP